MTITSYVEEKFVPEHVAAKGAAGRTHYRSILKHVLSPEEVHRIFHENAGRSRNKLKTVPDWPYLSNLQLGEVRPEHVEKLISAALNRGYSTQTATHIRNVVSAIYSHARKEHDFEGDNPAIRAALPGMNRKEAHALTLDEAKTVLARMRYPEKQMTMMALASNMNVAEICGMQWKCVNLSEQDIHLEAETIPPETIAVKSQWYRGELSDVKPIRARNIPVRMLLPVLLKLSTRSRFVGPDDFVLVSQAGTPINETNIATRRLKAIGEELQMPWLSWQVFRRTHKAFLYCYGADYESYLSMLVSE